MASLKSKRFEARAIWMLTFEKQKEEILRLEAEGHTHVPVPDLENICAENWKTLSEGEKKKYYNMVSLFEVKEKEVKRLTNKKRDPNAPKKYLSSYLHFSKTQRPLLLAEKPGLKPTEVVKKIAKLWNALDDELKQVYVKMANEDKKRYTADVKKMNVSSGSSVFNVFSIS